MQAYAGYAGGGHDRRDVRRILGAAYGRKGTPDAVPRVREVGATVGALQGVRGFPGGMYGGLCFGVGWQKGEFRAMGGSGRADPRSADVDNTELDGQDGARKLCQRAALGSR
jgi:hypothetical protein